MDLKLFEDPQAQKDVLERGWTIQPLLDRNEIQELREIHDRLLEEVPMDWYVTAWNTDVELKKKIFWGIRGVIEEKLQEIIPEYQIIMASFVTKRANSTTGTLGMHQDYSFVDHSQEIGLHVWVPLVDVDRRNGCMNVVEGSQHFGHVSATPPNAGPHTDICQYLYDEYLTEVPQEAGTALIFDSRLLHATDENTTGQPRPAALMNTVPRRVEPRLYFCNQNSPTKLEVYQVNSEFLLNLEPNSYVADPEARGAKFLQHYDYVNQPMSPEQVDARSRTLGFPTRGTPTRELAMAGSAPAPIAEQPRSGLGGWFRRGKK